MGIVGNLELLYMTIWRNFVLKFDDVLQGLDSNKEDAVEDQLPSPSLMLLTRTDLYDEKKEEKIAEIEYSKSNGDSQVPELLTKGRRRRGRPRWTHVKSHRSRSCASGVSYYSRAYSGTDNHSSRSLISSVSGCPSRSHRRNEYDTQDRLIAKRTRYLAEVEREELLIDEPLRCQFKDCPITDINNYDVLNLHMIEDHKVPALYICGECDAKYTSSILRLHHSNVHNFMTLYCLMCGAQFDNCIHLQRHMDQHSIQNIKCEYCDKSYISLENYKIHKRLSHRAKKPSSKRKPLKLDMLCAVYKPLVPKKTATEYFGDFRKPICEYNGFNTSDSEVQSDTGSIAIDVAESKDLNISVDCATDLSAEDMER